MTGFGVATGPVAGGRLQCEIRTVNHRQLNIQVRTPSALQPLEEPLRDLVRSTLTRGAVSVQVRWVEEPARPSAVTVDLERARAVLDAMRRLRDALDLKGEPDLQAVARFPEVMGSQAPPEAETVPAEPVLAVAREALDGVRAMREREGQALTAELRGLLDTINEARAAVEGLAPDRVVRERDRLRAAVAELMDGRPVNEDRLAQEIAHLADKLDIREELVRLATHLGAARGCLARSEPVGRELGFLGQEMLREVNTIGSKANDAAITQQVIAMKGAVDSFREQLENLE